MTNKEFTAREKGMIKATAKTVYPMYDKLQKKAVEIEQLQLEYETLNNQIKNWEAGVKDLTGGHTSYDLVKREFVQTGTDEKNRPIRKAVYSFRDEENIIPVECETEIPNDVILDN